MALVYLQLRQPLPNSAGANHHRLRVPPWRGTTTSGVTPWRPAPAAAATTIRSGDGDDDDARRKPAATGVLRATASLAAPAGLGQSRDLHRLHAISAHRAATSPRRWSQPAEVRAPFAASPRCRSLAVRPPPLHTAGASSPSRGLPTAGSPPLPIAGANSSSHDLPTAGSPPLRAAAHRVATSRPPVRRLSARPELADRITAGAPLHAAGASSLSRGLPTAGSPPLPTAGASLSSRDLPTAGLPQELARWVAASPRRRSSPTESPPVLVGKTIAKPGARALNPAGAQQQWRARAGHPSQAAQGRSGERERRSTRGVPSAGGKVREALSVSRCLPCFLRTKSSGILAYGRGTVSRAAVLDVC
ncbi:hypothetical protein DAI22_03g341301 [Oryza sativa Japonica Group]|nr:hypothetical protein DAI22_03g341301 [Oryza sativa Japonica Group]